MYDRESFETAQRYDGIFERLTHRSLIQGDPNPENIFLGDRIRLIDREFSRYSVPEEDLTFFVQTFELDDEQTRFFLDAYGYRDDHTRYECMMLLQVWGIICWRLDRIHSIETHPTRAHQKKSDPDELRSEIVADLEDVFDRLRDS